jgi:hypothetical protein
MDPFTLVLLVMLGFVVLLIAGIGSQHAPNRPRRPLLPRIVAGSAIVGSLLTIVGGIVALVATFSGQRLTLVIPVNTNVELTPAALRDSAARVVGGATQQAETVLTATGLDATTRVLVAVEQVITTAVVVTVLLMIARLAQQSMSPEPFSPRLSRVLVVGGATLAIGMTAAQVAAMAAATRAHEQLFALRPGAVDGAVYVPPTWTFEVWPIGVGLVLVVVAGLIRGGERLQRDTAGLV